MAVRDPGSISRSPARKPARPRANLKAAVDHGDLTQSLGHKRLRKPLAGPMRVRLRFFRSLSAPTSCAISSIPTAVLRFNRPAGSARANCAARSPGANSGPRRIRVSGRAGRKPSRRAPSFAAVLWSRTSQNTGRSPAPGAAGRRQRFRALGAGGKPPDLDSPPGRLDAACRIRRQARLPVARLERTWASSAMLRRRARRGAPRLSSISPRQGPNPPRSFYGLPRWRCPRPHRLPPARRPEASLERPFLGKTEFLVKGTAQGSRVEFDASDAGAFQMRESRLHQTSADPAAPFIGMH